MNKLSAVVLTKNEEHCIERCVKSLLWCDEILLIDDFSTDKTTKIADAFDVKLFKHKLNNNFAQQHNFGMSKASNMWVLFVDADEVVTDALRNSIKETLQNPAYNSYSLSRKNVFFDRKLYFQEAGHTPLIRLMKKGTGEWKRSVHEFWETPSPVGKLKGDLLHYSYDSIRDMVNKINYYSVLHAHEVQKEGKKVSIIKIVLYPSVKFLKKFFVEHAYKDGVRGFIVAISMSFHSFLSWSYIWLNKR